MHIGLIPDGNRRYMAKQGITNLSKSYEMGIERFHQFLEWCNEREVDAVTIYALSLENMKSRSGGEIETLLEVFSDQAVKALEDQRIHDNQIRINLCGDIESLKKLDGKGLAARMLENLEKLIKSTKEYEGLTLNMAIGYGGQQEIINAARQIAEEGGDWSEENFKEHLWIKDYPEIIIRTSESRLSNFLTWQSAYSEIYFVDKLWQEFSEEDLDGILKDFKDRERRFGR